MTIRPGHLGPTMSRSSKDKATQLINDAIAAAKKLGITTVEVTADWDDTWWYTTPPIKIETEQGEGTIAQVPGCCGLAVVTNALAWQKLDKLRECLETTARAMGYGALIWTHVTNWNPDVTKSYTRDFEFTNPKSGRIVFLEHKAL